ncbi:protein YIPF7 isoform X2 [Molothrus ater]|uniref:protein YIPF7 isoform X2 n=1 Tax=Molothrus ater TaxID=84834 RepID=UPI0023E75545|nr:protein YIPF7 isoform X2 [Molothrus ater]
MSSFEQFHIDFYQSNYTIEDQEEGCNSYGSDKNLCESRKRQAEEQPAGGAFVPSDMLLSPQSYSGSILQPACSPDAPSQLGYVDGFDEEPPLLEGRESSFWLRVRDECYRVPCHACPAEPDERLGSLSWLCCKCAGLLPAAHGHPVLCCSSLLAAGDPRNCVSSVYYWMVQFVSLQNFYVCIGYGRTAAPDCIPMCFTLWTFCTSNSFLRCIFW